MSEFFHLIIGIVLLGIVFYDFFNTTLSVSSTSFITAMVSRFVQDIFLKAHQQFGRKIFTLSGMTLNMSIIFVWIILVWAGLFFIFSFDAQSIVNENGKIASTSERLYYTGYVLSTLGIGDFFPISFFTQFLTSCFAFFGFIFFTTAMTYLISLYAAIINKQSLSTAIRNLGKSPGEIITNFHEVQPSFVYKQIDTLQQKIGLLIEQYKAYPVLHYYHNTELQYSFSLNIVNLDEAMTILLGKADSPHLKEFIYLRRTTNTLLEHIQIKYKKQIQKEKTAPEIDWHHQGVTLEMAKRNLQGQEIELRRKSLGFILKNENLNWEHVYPENKGLLGLS